MKKYISLIIIIFITGCASVQTKYDDGINNIPSSIVKNDDGTNSPNQYYTKNTASVNTNISAKKLPDIKNEKTIDTISALNKESSETATTAALSLQLKQSSVKDKISTDKTTKEISVMNSDTFYYPVSSVDILKDFSNEENKKFSGIELKVDSKTPIKTSAPGWVIFVGKQAPFAKTLIVIFHNKEYLTMYSNIENVKVKKGDYIKNLDTVIGYAGDFLHFEIRQKNSTGIVTYDPKKVLQKRRI